jgi:hypothetical protein
MLNTQGLGAVNACTNARFVCSHSELNSGAYGGAFSATACYAGAPGLILGPGHTYD